MASYTIILQHFNVKYYTEFQKYIIEPTSFKSIIEPTSFKKIFFNH